MIKAFTTIHVTTLVFLILQGQNLVHLLCCSLKRTLDPDKKRYVELHMKCFVCPDISSEWSSGSCSECRSMPTVLRFIDGGTHWAVFFFLLPHYCVPNVRGISFTNQLLSQFNMTFKRQLCCK